MIKVTKEATMLNNLNDLQARIARVPVGRPVEVFLGIDRDLDATELARLEKELTSGGLNVTDPVTIGSGPWANTLRLAFFSPASQGPHSTGMWPLAVLLVLSLGTVGIAGILGWKVSKIPEQIANYIVPLALIAAGTLVAVKLIQRPKAA